VSHRLFVATAVSIAAGIAFIPGAAHAADPAHALRASATSGGAALSSAVSGGKSFTSPAGKSLRLQQAQAGTAKRATAKSLAVTATGNAIYATTGAFSCTTDTGNGTQANPYCKVQDAVNVASPGDTVYVIGTEIGSDSKETVTVSTSNITIAGTGTQAWIQSAFEQPAALILNHVTGVTISNLMLTSVGSSGIEILGSSNVTLDSDYVNERPITGTGDALTIDATSSGIAVTRTYLDTTAWVSGTNAVAIAAGASNITLAGDVLSDSGIQATGVSGLDIAGNTIQRGCSTGIDVEGASTGVSIENNLLEDANPNTNYGSGGGYLSQCTTGGNGWAPDITVGAAAAPATTAGYNDFYFYGADPTAAYSWAGTSYPTLGAFQSAVAQGAHDTLDTVEAGLTYFRPNEPATVDVVPAHGSAAVSGANPGAPGQLSSDFYGTSPYTSRGAIQYFSNPTLALGLDAHQTSAHGIELTQTVTGASIPSTLNVDWGDGNTAPVALTGSTTLTSDHDYIDPGTYTITVTVTDRYKNIVGNSVQVVTAGSDYTPYGPTRILDTRSGLGAPRAKLTSSAPIKLKVAGTGGVPAGATAVALNLTLTNTTGGGDIAAFPDGSTEQTSNLNYAAGQTVANLAIVPVGNNGEIDLAKEGPGAVDIIADVEGYFTQSAASGYSASASGPTRTLDTRSGLGAPKKPLTSTGVIRLKVAGVGDVPAGVTAVSLNVTLTNTSGNGDVIAYPDGKAQPTASNVNYAAGQTIANAAVVPVGADGYIDLVKQGPGAVDVIADVEGYFTSGGPGAYLAINPTRLFDSRTLGANGKLSAQYYYPLPIDQTTGHVAIPGVTTWVLNTTVTNVTGTGFLTVFPDNANGAGSMPLVPNASNLNFAKGATVPNLAFAVPSSAGIIDFYNGAGAGSVDLIVDAFGAYQNG
jgi:hypothetical protein